MHGVQNTSNVIGLTGLYTANGVRALKPRHCLSNAPVVVWTVEGQASESSLYIKAALILRARVCSCHTFINILAAAAVGCQGVAIDRTGTVEAAGGVVTAIGANMTSSGQGTLIYIFTSHAIYVTELVTTATVTLVGAVHVGTLLATWVALTLIQIVTIPAITSELEAGGAATLVRSKCVLTLMSTQAARVVPAFINILTDPTDAVEDVARLTLAAVGAYQVDATMTRTDLFRALTLININAAIALLIEVVSSAAVNRVPLAHVGADCVDTGLPAVAWARLANTLIDINAAAKGILDISSTTLDLRDTTERPLGVLALKLWATVMDTSLTLINIFTIVVVSEFIASPTADLSLATERALCVDTALSCSTVAGSQQTLVDILTALSIWLEFEAFVAGASVIAYTVMSTFPLAQII